MASVPGCGNIAWEFTNLCDTEKLWGIIVIGVAGVGLLLTLIFTIVFSANLMRFVRHEKHRYSTLLYFVLVGVFLLLSFSITFVIKPTEIVCILRRVGIGIACTVTLSPLLVAITRTWRMSYLDEIRCGWLALAVSAFVCVEIIIVTEWCILTPPVVRGPTNSSNVTMCEVNSRDLPLSLVFNGLLLLLYVVSSIVSVCKPDHNVSMNRRFSSFSISSLATSILVTLLAAAWVAMVVYGNTALGKDDWFDPATAIFMVGSALCVLILIFSPVLATMRRLRSLDEDDELFGSGGASPARPKYGSDKYASQSTLPNDRNAYGTSMERLQSFRSASGETALAMSHLQSYHPVPAKRNGVNNNVDRLRAPTGGRLNPTLELTEEDIWRDRHL